jgi:hypothetical protein
MSAPRGTDEPAEPTGIIGQDSADDGGHHDHECARWQPAEQRKRRSSSLKPNGSLPARRAGVGGSAAGRNRRRPSARLILCGGWRRASSPSSFPRLDSRAPHSLRCRHLVIRRRLRYSNASTDLQSVCRGVRTWAGHVPCLVLPPHLWLLMKSPSPSQGPGTTAGQGPGPAPARSPGGWWCRGGRRGRAGGGLRRHLPQGRGLLRGVVADPADVVEGSVTPRPETSRSVHPNRVKTPILTSRILAGRIASVGLGRRARRRQLDRAVASGIARPPAGSSLA